MTKRSKTGHWFWAQGPAFAFNPEPEADILPGDKLVVLGRPDSLKRLETDVSVH